MDLHVSAVVAWSDGERCGVKLELADGRSVVVADDYLPSAGDYTSTRNELIFDSAWAGGLGRRLADTLGVPFRDEI